MDYMYNFKQAHIDRLESAGVKTYHPNDGINVSPKQALKQVNKRVRVTLSTVASLLSR